VLVSVVAHTPAVVGTPQPLLELAGRCVDRGVEVGSAGFRAQRAAGGAADDGDVLVILGLAGVQFVVELDLVAPLP
jgi:hypothetical protein